MELHYVALTDALAFVEDRGVARVHIVRADGKPTRIAKRARTSPPRRPKSFRELRRAPWRGAAATRAGHGDRPERGVPRRAGAVGRVLRAVEEQQDAHHADCASTSPGPGRRTISCGCSSGAEPMFCPDCGTWNRARRRACALRHSAARARRGARRAAGRGDARSAAPRAAAIASFAASAAAAWRTSTSPSTCCSAREVVIKVLHAASRARCGDARALPA